MTARKLLETLQKFTPEKLDVPVLLAGGRDHSYLTVCDVRIRAVERDERGEEFHEYYSDDDMSPGGQKAKALVIS